MPSKKSSRLKKLKSLQQRKPWVFSGDVNTIRQLKGKRLPIKKFGKSKFDVIREEREKGYVK